MTSHKLFREPNAAEREIFYRLLEPHFLGRDTLREQLSNCLVKVIDQTGSLKILLCSGVRVYAHLLLYVVGGKVEEPEVYKDVAISKLLSKIGPSRLELFCPSLRQR